MVIAVAAHALLLLGLEIEAPETGARPTQGLELMVVTEPGVDAAASVPARVSAQADRAGETQALLPEIEAAAEGSIDSNALDGADAAESDLEQPLAPSEPTVPSPPAEPPPAASEISESAPPPEPARAPPSHAEPAAPRLEALPALGAEDASSAAEAEIKAESIDRLATPEPKAALLPDPAPAAPEQPEQPKQPEQLEQPKQPERAELDQPAPPISAADIFASRSAEMASLAARIEERSHAYASRTRRKAISTATREYIYANYMEAWRRKVERIGNLNYPREARELGLFGSLILHVAVRADGSLEGIRVVRSSGHEVLDQAAVRIVELAAPFAAFPPDIKRETDVLDITRTWQFQRNHELSWGN
ncbi:energy transducer TonB [Halochromatium sp.]